MTSGCLGDVVAALVDGELDHAARERAHRHLAHCAGCRAEVADQRRLKTRLSGVDQPELPGALTDRLLRLPVPADEPRGRAGRPPSRPGAAARLSSRPAGSAPRTQRTADRRPRRAARRRATTGSAVALLGVAAALALGAPPPRPPSTPVDPATDAFVAEFVRTTADGTSSAVVPAPPAGPTTFVPLTRTALLGTGSARTTR